MAINGYIPPVWEQRDAAEHYEKILRLTSSEASQIFHGELKNWNRCKECDVKTGSEARFWNLPLPLINSNNYYSVEKGIADFFSPSEITGDDQMYCEKCDKKQDAVLHCEVSRQPDVLVLLLKRFEFDYRYMTYVKINQPVNVPYTVQIPQNQSYELYAFVEHFGELRYGHYISTIKSQDDNQWYIFDDSKVTRSKDLPALERSQSAYLLFYRKQKEAPLVNVSNGTEDSSRATEKEVGVQDENEYNVENKDTSVRALLKRPFDKTKQEPEEVKKPKQELSGEGRDLNQPGWKSPDNQDLDVGGCSSSQQMYFMENAIQEHKVDQTFSDHNVHSGISQEKSEKIDPLTQFSPNRDQWDRAGQSESELFCTSDMRSSSSEALLNAVDYKAVSEDFNLRATCEIDLPNEQVLTMEVHGGQVERQESRGVNSYIGSVQNQINTSEAEEKKHCDGNGGCEGLRLSPDVDMEGDRVGRKKCGSQEKVLLARMESCCEEESAKTIEDDSVKTFHRKTSDSHQICTSDSEVAHCIIDIECSGSSMISQESGESESKVFCREDLKSTTSETVLNAGDREGDGGMEFNLGADYRLGHRDEHALTLEVQRDDEGRQVNEDTESSELKMPTTMSRSNNDECVKVEDDLECEIVAQSPIVMQEDLKMDTGQVERTHFGENSVSMEGQERTAVRIDVKLEGSGNEAKGRRLLTKYDLYLETYNSPKFDSNQSQSERWPRKVYKIVNQKEPEAKCQSIITEHHHSAAKSEVEESEARFVQRRSVDASRSDKDREQREMAAPSEGHSKQTVGPVFQSSVVTTVGDTETITLVLNKRQSGKGEGQVRREGRDVVRSLQHKRNAESPTDSLAKSVVSLTLRKEEDADLETEAGGRNRKDMYT